MSGKPEKISYLAVLIFSEIVDLVKPLLRGRDCFAQNRPQPSDGITPERRRMSTEPQRKGLQSLSEAIQAQLPNLPDRPRDSGQKKVRATTRAAQWRADMARACAYQLSRARTPEEAERIEADYAQVLESKPDFASYRRKSEFCPAPRLNLNRDALARLKFKMQAIRRGTWFTKEKGKHSGGVPHSVMEVFDALLSLAVKHGQVFPSLVGLGILATRSKQTVVNAIKVLESYGVVTRIRRIKRIRTPMGQKTVQDTNAYTLQEPNAFGDMAYRCFVSAMKERSESRNQAARKPDSYSLIKGSQNLASRDRGGGFFDHLRAAWETS